MFELIRDGGGLDLNSPYAYLLLTRAFADTSTVAEVDGALAGVILGLRLPADPTTLFVWQVGVAPSERGTGLGRRMLDGLVAEIRPTYVEATVTPSNVASHRLFAGFARDHDAACEVAPWAAPEDFPGTGHEREDLYRIGPLPT